MAELRKAFQQHVRDERKELLPAVLKALDDEEAEAIVEKIEGAKAEVEEAKRAEAEQRRAAAREERERPSPWLAKNASGSKPCGKRPRASATLSGSARKRHAALLRPLGKPFRVVSAQRLRWPRRLQSLARSRSRM